MKILGNSSIHESNYTVLDDLMSVIVDIFKTIIAVKKL